MISGFGIGGNSIGSESAKTGKQNANNKKRLELQIYQKLLFAMFNLNPLTFTDETFSLST